MESEYFRTQTETTDNSRSQQNPAPSISANAVEKGLLSQGGSGCHRLGRRMKWKALQTPQFVLIISFQIRGECVSTVPAVRLPHIGSRRWEMALASHLTSSLRLAPSVTWMGPEIRPLTPSPLSSWRITTLVRILITSSSSQQDFSPPQPLLMSHKQNLRSSDRHRSYPNNPSMRLIAQSYH